MYICVCQLLITLSILLTVIPCGEPYVKEIKMRPSLSVDGKHSSSYSIIKVIKVNRYKFGATSKNSYYFAAYFKNYILLFIVNVILCSFFCSQFFKLLLCFYFK